MIILLMAAGVLTSSLDSGGGREDEDRELEDILGEDYLKEPAENISMTNVTNKFDEDIVEEELSDAEANSSTMATWEIAIWTCVGLLGLLVAADPLRDFGDRLRLPFNHMSQIAQHVVDRRHGAHDRGG